MKSLTVILFLFISQRGIAQKTQEKHYDTLYYTSGLIRPCTIRFIDHKTVHFSTTTRKGIAVKSTVTLSNLKYYLDFDSTGKILLNADQVAFNEKDTSKYRIEVAIDTVFVPKHHLSINPISLALLGVNVDYMHRLGKMKQFALHIPLRILPIAGILLQSGVGVNFIPYNTMKTSVFVGLSTQFYILGDETIVAFPITMGFVRNITNKLTYNGYIGLGPVILNDGSYNGVVMPDAHIGLGFKFGERYKTTNQRKVRVKKI